LNRRDFELPSNEKKKREKRLAPKDGAVAGLPWVDGLRM